MHVVLPRVHARRQAALQLPDDDVDAQAERDDRDVDDHEEVDAHVRAGRRQHLDVAHAPRRTSGRAAELHEVGDNRDERDRGARDPDANQRHSDLGHCHQMVVAQWLRHRQELDDTGNDNNVGGDLTRSRFDGGWRFLVFI